MSSQCDEWDPLLVAAASGRKIVGIGLTNPDPFGRFHILLEGYGKLQLCTTPVQLFSSWKAVAYVTAGRTLKEFMYAKFWGIEQVDSSPGRKVAVMRTSNGDLDLTFSLGVLSCLQPPLIPLNVCGELSYVAGVLEVMSVWKLEHTGPLAASE